jgi:hypothetical protein
LNRGWRICNPLPERRKGKRGKAIATRPQKPLAQTLAHESQNPAEPTPTTAPASTPADPPAVAATDPDLARIVAAWPTLPEAIRRAMLALLGLGE